MALQRTRGTSLIWISFQGLKNQVKVKLSIVSCPPVTTVLIKRPDLKFQLGFSVQNGIVGNSQSVSNKSVPITGGNFAKKSKFLPFLTSDLQLDARRHRRARRRACRTQDHRDKRSECRCHGSREDRPDSLRLSGRGKRPVLQWPVNHTLWCSAP